MKKVTGRVKIDENKIRHFVRLISDECTYGTREYENELFTFLGVIAQSRDLSFCGHQPFDRMSIRHDGDRWIAEAEAIETTEPKT
jgi:hypothetical protein